MNRTTSEAEEFVNDLDLGELGILIDVLAKVDRLAMKDGQPVFVPAEIDLIGRFQDFNNGVDAEADEESEADEDEDGDADGESDEEQQGPATTVETQEGGVQYTTTEEVPPGQVSATGQPAELGYEDIRANA